ncbi:amino acid ABC transporter permease [Clostridium saccharoperbutylacetonicum]|uniref:Amino acid ABC transporter membrane protein 2, PAAT family n=1 Tax=Clostridium saccharoperbutylacetonicum N1-4(HMT) TaxID=931276 RepID=M1MN51_9CLOT|nr:amino acid ABC transporter permease [Clostridium saccharoperbutylacetonicum]AGF57638.1 amino acid ABC transporter membrane protein 2, PAAT family [Clostridium saccharoperbutylacetonicum N1-4(HMT)]AQR96332.1 octopine transport system permease protein OccM [Clostridium saccharoperbutylacetonicum]NRT61594.1 polar amino acid transport system permease protein [Clostridium saccharoperbutylacetonicum]NSB24917.1 polar amino acid transport system permease protein [Clostridium saccharoperbutylacetonic
MQNSGFNVIFQGNNIGRLFEGLFITAEIAFISIILGSLLGILIGLSRTTKSKLVLFVNRVYLEAFRIIPTLVWLFIFYFGVTTALNINISGEIVSIIVFTLWGAAEMGDIVRGALESLPKHQIESGKALGMNNYQLYRYILIPQAIRRMIPGTINLATRMIKTTSLVVLIGVIDVVKIGQQIIESSRFQFPTASFWIYGLIFFLYFIICFPLSKISKRLEAKWND